MAAVSELGVYVAAAQEQIKDFPHSEADCSFDVNLNDLVPKSRMVPSHEQEGTSQIQQLEKDIQWLEQMIDKTEKEHQGQKRQKNPQRLLSQKGKVNGQTEEDVNEFRAENSSLLDRLKVLHGLLGLELTDTESKLLTSGEECLTWQEAVTGRCDNVDFKLELSVEEKLGTSDSNKEATITDLAVLVSEEVYNEIKPVIDRAEEERSVHGFLQSLKPYCKWRDAREKTFSHFLHKYPDLTSLHTEASTQSLIITHPNHKCIFSVNWCFKVNQMYTPEPDITLSLKVHERVCQLDKDHTVRSLPETFHRMLQELGIENAIHTLIKLVQS